jgi:hypothetical protein
MNVAGEAEEDIMGESRMETTGRGIGDFIGDFENRG